MNKRKREKKYNFFGGNYWQSADFNQRSYIKNLEWIVALAVNRFKWAGLPDTCNTRFLEQTLIRNGSASIARDSSDTWYTLMYSHGGQLSIYGEPSSWVCMGANGAFQYNADWSSGAICYDNRSFTNPWNTIQLLARKLTHIERTEDINLSHQQTPWLFTAPEEKRLELSNLVKQVVGGEPVVMANTNMHEHVQYEAISTGTPFIGLELNVQLENTWRQVYRFLGIEHLAVEKTERVIEAEAKANNAPAVLKRLDGLEARRDAARHVSQILGSEVNVYFNDDIESYNWAFANNIERQGEIMGELMDVSEVS